MSTEFRRTLSHDDIADLLGAYALHAVEPWEAEQVDAHLQTCPECSVEFAEHLDVTAGIATTDLDATLEPVTSALVDSLMGRIGIATSASARPQSSTLNSMSAGPASRPPLSDGPTGATTTTSASTQRATGPTEPVVVDLETARLRRRNRRFAAVGAIVAAAAIPTAMSLRSSTSPTLAALATRTARESGARSADLGGATGTLARVVVGKNGNGYFTSTKLATLPAGKTYQLWAITKSGSAPISAGLLGREPTVAAFTVSADAAAYAISVEPEGGSTGPTSEPLALGNLV